MPLIKNTLDLVLGWNYQKNDGSNDFTTEGATALEDVTAVDDYDLQQFEAKLLYSVSDNLAIAVGYLYEKFDYTDDHYENYTDYNNAGFNSYYLTGATDAESYEANIGYLALNYHF